MSELSEEARALLAREAHLDEPTPSELAHGRAQIFATLGLPLPPSAPLPVDGATVGDAASATGATTAPSTTTTTVATTAPSSAGLGLSTKLAIASLVLGTATFVGYRAMREDAPTPPRAVDVAAPPVAPTPPQPIEPPPVVPDPSDTATPAPTVEPTAQPTRPRAPATPEPNDALASESMLVAAAEAQLRAGHAAEALSLYDRYLREHPGGALRHESVTGRIAALCRLGRLDAGRAELARFSAQSPRSPSLPRLRAACGVDETVAPPEDTP